MSNTYSHTPLRFSGVALLLSALAACAHPAPSASVSSPGTGGGGGGSATVTFSLTDLDGSWYGKLEPTSLARAQRNFYIKISGGVVTEAADSLGNQWLSADSNHTLDFSSTGALNTSMASIVEQNEMILNAQMDDAMTLLTGEFSALAPSDVLVEGSFTLQRSAGAGEFSASNLEGDWAGHGTNTNGRRRSLNVSLAADGTILIGEVLRPLTLEQIHVYSAGSGTFALTDDTVGRLDNVVMLADGGDVTTLEYLLVSQDGSLLGGPGFDTLMGRGVVTLGPSSD
jgi:hypothetical protein